MAAGLLSNVVRKVRRAALIHGAFTLTDGQLLLSFLNDGEVTAFESLVRRHGPMVLGVCRRILRNEADSEDCFQATFLVLLRKAASINPPEMVGNWLHGVALRTALAAGQWPPRAGRRKERLQTCPNPAGPMRGLAKNFLPFSTKN